MKKSSQPNRPTSLPEKDDTMLYTLAHDIKSPINQLRGLLTIARRMNNSKELDDLLRLAMESNVKLTEKVNELLDMNLKDLQVSAFHFEETVDNIWQSLQIQAGEAGIKMIRKCHVQEKVVTNKPRLKSILQNLLENAIKYRDRDKTDPSIMVNCFRQGEDIVVKVADNGIGIETEKLEHIFHARFQTNDEARGHGMGLYLARQNAVHLGGDLTVESKAGDGTTFTLTFPDLSSAR